MNVHKAENDVIILKNAIMIAGILDDHDSWN